MKHPNVVESDLGPTPVAQRPAGETVVAGQGGRDTNALATVARLDEATGHEVDVDLGQRMGHPLARPPALRRAENSRRLCESLERGRIQSVYAI